MHNLENELVRERSRNFIERKFWNLQMISGSSSVEIDKQKQNYKFFKVGYFGNVKPKRCYFSKFPSSLLFNNASLLSSLHISPVGMLNYGLFFSLQLCLSSSKHVVYLSFIYSFCCLFYTSWKGVYLFGWLKSKWKLQIIYEVEFIGVLCYCNCWKHFVFVIVLEDQVFSWICFLDLNHFRGLLIIV